MKEEAVQVDFYTFFIGQAEGGFYLEEMAICICLIQMVKGFVESPLELSEDLLGG